MNQADKLALSNAAVTALDKLYRDSRTTDLTPEMVGKRLQAIADEHNGGNLHPVDMYFGIIELSRSKFRQVSIALLLQPVRLQQGFGDCFISLPGTSPTPEGWWVVGYFKPGEMACLSDIIGLNDVQAATLVDIVNEILIMCGDLATDAQTFIKGRAAIRIVRS